MAFFKPACRVSNGTGKGSIDMPEFGVPCNHKKNEPRQSRILYQIGPKGTIPSGRSIVENTSEILFGRIAYLKRWK